MCLLGVRLLCVVMRVCVQTCYFLFLTEAKLILLLTQAKAQVLCLLLSH